MEVSNAQSYKPDLTSNLACQIIIFLVLITFFARYEYWNPDGDDTRCYGQQLYSPASDDYTVRVTREEVEGMQNEDVSHRFSLWFKWGLYQTIGYFVLQLSFVLMVKAGSITEVRKLAPCYCIILISELAFIICGLMWRFQESGRLCAHFNLIDSGYAMKLYLVLVLIGPCCPCALILACCVA